MSFADDFGHDIPSDDYGGDYSSRRPRCSYRTSTNYGDSSVTRYFKKVHHETRRAYLIEFNEGRTWIPKSEIRMFDLDRSKVIIPVWLSQSLTYIKED